MSTRKTNKGRKSRTPKIIPPGGLTPALVAALDEALQTRVAAFQMDGSFDVDTAAILARAVEQYATARMDRLFAVDLDGDCLRVRARRTREAA